MNFDYLKKFPELKKLTGFCNDAEQLVYSRPYLSGMSARQGLEYIVKLIYASKIAPTDGLTMFDMLDDQRFTGWIGDSYLLNCIHYVRKMGNAAVHQGDLTSDEALKVLEYLHFIVGEIMVIFGKTDDYPQYVKPEKNAKPSAPEKTIKQEKVQPEPDVIAEFTQRMRKTIFSTAHGRDENENKKLFIRASLRESGWKIVNVPGQSLPCTATLNCTIDDSGTLIDYVLNGRDNRPLAVIEETETKKNPVLGRKKAIAAADTLEKKYGYKPIVYYTDGYHIFCIDQLGFPVRRVFDFHSIEELELLKQRQTTRQDITSPVINENIINRKYQKEAVNAVCNAFSQKRRRSLIVMATGTGKTRVSIACVDVLMKASWVKNVLFLADRTSLVKQAHKNYNKLLPNEPTSVYTGESTERDENARIIFSTYKTMLNLINDEKKQFGIGRFDLIIIDEAHRSIFKKYGALFHYFDAMMLGLTATPRSEENKSTYQVFEIRNNEPDLAYELEQAMEDKYLVGFSILDRTTDIMKRGIKYDDLTDSQKEQIEDEFNPEGEEGVCFLGTIINANKIGKSVINLGTINAMLSDLMKNGLKVDGGDKIGKSIIFADNHIEAVKIVEQFHKLYKEYDDDFCVLIDSQVVDSDKLIEKFEVRDGLPQIAVSVDKLDTGVDVPDILNLVFFKSVKSRIKFLQMIGRGTRLSPDVFGPGEDKRGFLIFDYYDNFGYFNEHGNWKNISSDKGNGALHSQTYSLNKRKLSILKQLQESSKRTEFEEKYMEEIQNYFVSEVRCLNNDSVEVQYNMAFVSKYRTEEYWQNIQDETQTEIEEHILELLYPERVSMKTKTFDMLIYTIEVQFIKTLAEGKDPWKIRNGFRNVTNEITERMKELLKLKTIPEVIQNEQLLRDMIDCKYIYDDFSTEKAETVRKKLRGLMQYLPEKKNYYIVDIPDRVEDNSDISSENQKSYCERAMEFISESNYPSLAKIRNLDPLSDAEKEELKKIFFDKLGTEAEFTQWAGNVPFLHMLRLQTGISEEAIQTKFGTILGDASLNSTQKNYLEQIIGYAVKNGDITFMDLQQVSPFCDYDITDLFGDRILLIKNLVNGIHKPIV